MSVRDLTYRIVIRAFRIVFRLLGLRITVTGAEHLPVGPAVLASNHVSYLDFTFVGLAASTRSTLVRFMAKKSVFDAPVAGRLMRRMGHIPVDRVYGASAYRRAIRALEAGETVGLFPEATISRTWTLRTFKPGAAALAVRQGVPLVPIVIWGPQRIATTGPKISLRWGRAVTITVGEPIDIAPGETVEAVLDRLRGQMAQLLDAAQRSYPDRPRRGEDPWWLPRHLGGTAPSARAAAALELAAIEGRRRP